MANFSAVVKLGNSQVKIESNKFLEVYEAIAALEELADATEQEDVRLVVRPLKGDRGIFKKYGFRRKDGAILDLGMSQDQDKLIPLFPYSKFSPDYKGFRKFNETEQA
jgi:hypothetical protein